MCSLCQGLTAQVLPGSNDIKWTVFKLWLRIQLCTGSFRYFLFFFFCSFTLMQAVQRVSSASGSGTSARKQVASVQCWDVAKSRRAPSPWHRPWDLLLFRLLPPYTSQAENMRRRIRRHKLKRLRSCKRTICSA